MTIKINPMPVVVTTALPTGIVDESYPETVLMFEGGTGSYSWVIVKGHLSDGLTLAGNVISGTPTKATRGIGQEKIITVEVTDSLGATAVGEVTITIYRK